MRVSPRDLIFTPKTMEYKVINSSNNVPYESSENLTNDVSFKSAHKKDFKVDSFNTKSDKVKRWDKKRILLDKYLDEVLRNVCTNKAQEPSVLPTLGHMLYSVEHIDSSKGPGQKENFHNELLSHSSNEDGFEDRLSLTSQGYSIDCLPQLGSLNLESDELNLRPVDPPCDLKSERFDNEFLSHNQIVMNPVSHDYYKVSHRNYNNSHEDEMMESNDHQQYCEEAYMNESPFSYKEDIFFDQWSNDDKPLDLSIPKEESSFHNMSFYSDCYEDATPMEFPSTEENVQQNSWLKKIKTGTRSRVRSPKSWEFLLRLLMDPKSNPSMIRWEDKTLGTFRLVQKDEIAKIWGMRSSKHKDGGLSYDNFARNLRYHYKTKMLVPVSEKHLVYKFSSEVMQKMHSLVN